MDPVIPTSPALGLEACATMPSFYMSIKNLNSGSYTCAIRMDQASHVIFKFVPKAQQFEVMEESLPN